jgi:hypothetical protein
MAENTDGPPAILPTMPEYVSWIDKAMDVIQRIEANAAAESAERNGTAANLPERLRGTITDESA